jgi:hypothetical protein
MTRACHGRLRYLEPKWLRCLTHHNNIHFIYDYTLKKCAKVSSVPTEISSGREASGNAFAETFGEAFGEAFGKASGKPLGKPLGKLLGSLWGSLWGSFWGSFWGSLREAYIGKIPCPANSPKFHQVDKYR